MTINNRKFIINAIGVCEGGGKRLLIDLIENLDQQNQYLVFIDSRLNHVFIPPKNVKIQSIDVSGFKRISFEWRLKKIANTRDFLLNFNNLPPLFSCRGKTAVFFQYRQILEISKQKNEPLYNKLRFFLQILWLNSKAKSVHFFIVQTPTMKRLMGRFKNVQVLPFFSVINPSTEAIPHAKSNPDNPLPYRFIFPATNYIHKNHRNLIKAWTHLGKENLFPELILTLNENKIDHDLVKTVKNKKLNVTFVGEIAHNEVLNFYHEVNALIFPSFCESFGLPLIEAHQAGLPILASELDYVRDVCRPLESFDPTSDRSIANAVKRFMGIQAPPFHFLSSEEFLEKLHSLFDS